MHLANAGGEGLYYRRGPGRILRNPSCSYHILTLKAEHRAQYSRAGAPDGQIPENPSNECPLEGPHITYSHLMRSTELNIPAQERQAAKEQQQSPEDNTGGRTNTSASRYNQIHQMRFTFERSSYHTHTTQAEHRVERSSAEALGVRLYTILSLPILYGVWHTQGGSGGGRMLRKSRAIVLQ